MISLSAACTAAGLAFWAFLCGRRFASPATGGARTASIGAVTGLIVAVLIWWAYVTTTSPGVGTLSDLWRSTVVAGGGAVPATTYLWRLALTFGFGLLFVCVGDFIWTKSGGFSDATSSSLRDVGLFYFIGVAAFLTVFVAVAAISGRAFASFVLVMVGFGAMALRVVASRRLVARAVAWIGVHGTTFATLAPVLVAVLCLLQYVVTRRIAPPYDQFAHFIVANNRIPLINRHFGQSLLASGVLFITGLGTDTLTLPRVAVNNWLFVSQIGFMILVYRVLRELRASPSGALFGLIFVMLGNAALSLLPQILYDHDYPVIMNLYTDSLFGLAGFAILACHVMSRAGAPEGTRESKTAWWRTLIPPALILMAFSYTAELNIVLFLVVVVLLLALKPFDERTRLHIPIRDLVAMLVISLCAITAGGAQGGIFASRFARAAQKENTPFFERGAAAASLSPVHARWWYLPAVSPGIQMGAGNLPLPAFYLAESTLQGDQLIAWTLSTPMNVPLMEKVLGDSSEGKFKYAYAIYLVELRLFQTLRLVWFPFVGLVVLGTLVVAVPRVLAPTIGESDRVLAPLRVFCVLASASFAVGLLVVFFTNSVGGNGLYWKWALTRFFEPGLCLGMLAFALVLDRLLRLVSKPVPRYIVWLGFAGVMSFGTLFRILAYKDFVGG